MADPTDLTQDLAVEQELRQALRALQIPQGLSVEEAQSYLPTFAAGIQKLYDLRARQIVSASPSKAEGERQLETAAQQRIIKAIGRRRMVLVQQQDKPGKRLAPRPVTEASANESEEKQIGNWDSGVVHFRGHAAIPERPGPAWEHGDERGPADENTYVEDERGRRIPAPKDIQARFAHRCDWEEFIPSPVRFFIRDRDYDLVCEELTQALFRRRVYWTHQLESQLVETTPAKDAEAATMLTEPEIAEDTVEQRNSVAKVARQPRPDKGIRREPKATTQKLRQEYDSRNRPKLTPLVLDSLAASVFPREAAKVTKGSKFHKRLRDRVRVAIKRSR